MLPLVLSSDSHVFEPPDLWQTRIVEEDQILSGIGLISNAGARFDAPSWGCRASRCSSGRGQRAAALEERLGRTAGAVGIPGSGFLLSRVGRPAVSRAFSSQMIRPQSRPLQSKIWTATPVPSMNHSPWAGTMAETPVPGAVKDDRVMTSKAAQAVRRSQSAQRAEAGVCIIRFRPITP
jgi:hypothetical protein